MKNRIIVLHALLVASVGATIVTGYWGAGIQALIIPVSVTLFLLLATLLTWMQCIKDILVGYHQLVFRKPQKISLFNLANIGAIKKYQELVSEKLTVSAKLIANLSNPEDNVKLEKIVEGDPIGIALQKIKQELKALKAESDIHTWINQGLAQFGEVLRQKSDISTYSYTILASLTKYLNANQGALYIEQTNTEGERYLEMKACYAYERKKNGEAKITEGHGILGQCMLEHEFIFLTDVPKDFINITSGLGEATPTNIVIAPLLFNEKFYGVIELALFEVLQPHQVEFLKKISVSIAAEVSAMKTLEHTQALLAESDELGKRLKINEEEMKQNMEELAATQEEMSRNHKELEKKQTELNSFLSAIDNTIASVEFDLQGNVTHANELFLTITNFNLPALCKKHYEKLFTNGESVKLMWESLKRGQFFSGEFQMIGMDDREQFLNGTFNPIMDPNGIPYKIMMFAQFTTQEKEKVSDLTASLHAFKSILPVVEFNANYQCRSANEKFMKMFNIGRTELRAKHLNDFVDNELVGGILNQVNTHEPVTGPYFLTTSFKMGKTHAYEVSLSLLSDQRGNVTRIIMALLREVEENAALRLAL